MIHRYATCDLPGHQQLEFWNEVICRQFTELECRAGSRRAYGGSLSTWDMQGLQISMVSAEASLSANQGVLLMRAKRLVQDNLCDANLRPSAVATALGISDRYLRLLMQREGHTCASYILDERLDRVADALLKAGSQRLTVAELAYRWGFGSQSYFTRAFRKKFGMTPTEYRQHARR